MGHKTPNRMLMQAQNFSATGYQGEGMNLTIHGVITSSTLEINMLTWRMHDKQ